MGHPYAEGVLGDFEEESSRVAARLGPAAARRWYWWQLARSAWSLIRLTRLDGRVALRLLATAAVAYWAALTLLRIVSPAIVHAVAPSGLGFDFAYGATVLVAGVLAGYGAARTSAPRAIPGAVLFLSLTLSVGAVHVAAGAAAEIGFRVVKVAILAAAGCGGGLLGATRPLVHSD